MKRCMIIIAVYSCTIAANNFDNILYSVHEHINNLNDAVQKGSFEAKKQMIAKLFDQQQASSSPQQLPQAEEQGQTKQETEAVGKGLGVLPQEEQPPTIPEPPQQEGGMPPPPPAVPPKSTSSKKKNKLPTALEKGESQQQSQPQQPKQQQKQKQQQKPQFDPTESPLFQKMREQQE